jgi:putative phosphoribosyl transferase
MKLRDRQEAGRQLAVQLRQYANERPIIVALPRGGVPVAHEIALALGAELDIWVVRKLGVPWQRELGVGAVAEGGYMHLAADVLGRVGMSEDDLDRVVARERSELERRIRRFRGQRPRPELRQRSVILVDDGIATGGTVRAAIRAIRAEHPQRLVLAVPVAAADVLDELAPEVDRVVALLVPELLSAIGHWYEDFTQVSDEEVVGLLEHARRRFSGSVAAAARSLN